MPGVAVVTGAGRGFGREIAKRLAARGYTVLATDIDVEAAQRTAEEVGGFSTRLDVREPDAHRHAARLAVERGPLEVWVNNAGVLRTRVLGFTGSLAGDLRTAGLPITVHTVCPDGADTDMTRERAAETDSAIIWSAPRMLSAGEVADGVMGLLDSKQLVLVIPRWRGWLARSTALAGRHAVAGAEPLRKLGERRR